MGQPSDDESLLARWREGDAPAGAALFERYYEALARFFVNKVGLDCGDLVQATFLGCLEGLPRFRGEASFRTLLFAIARNQLLHHLRTKVRNEERFAPELTTVGDLQPSMTTLLGSRHEHRLLLEALRALPVELQLVVELYYWEQLKVREIAVIVDRPEGTIKTQLFKGRKLLEQQLARLADSPQQLESTVGGLERWASELREQLGRPR
ncbi:RNA polymerase sigma factor [Paraliomyxa miuraensis]|uniref:RNA polymerase sigma factor n=1 Tax=Paraliomyxa miuraensis TaxID=376150 RepID=UPI002258CF9C|nr:sigma-70 family RNA polymerase sigma factor [Paraliomyxa miuraensis]MCX4247085.1 sigma-70 family RNA polymerase sigma factor [Paraliomyxa miuraensis]